MVLAGRKIKKLEEAVKEVGDNAYPLIMDLSIQKVFLKDLVGLKKIWSFRLLFNNAGTGKPGTISLEDIEIHDWEQVVATNLSGSFYCIQGAFKIMKSQNPMGGRIINNGSVSAQSPRPNSSPYTSTKHAITGLTKSASLDGRKYNIAVGQIDIGNAATDMTKAMKSGVLQANGLITPEPTMDTENVVKVVKQMAALPLDANIQFVTVMATKMPLIGRG